MFDLIEPIVSTTSDTLAQFNQAALNGGSNVIPFVRDMYTYAVNVRGIMFIGTGGALAAIAAFGLPLTLKNMRKGHKHRVGQSANDR